MKTSQIIHVGDFIVSQGKFYEVVNPITLLRHPAWYVWLSFPWKMLKYSFQSKQMQSLFLYEDFK